MRIIALFLAGIIGIFSIIFGISLSLGNNVFADISFDTELETQWYNDSNPNATVSAIPEPLPLPINIVINITQTYHSH